MNEKLTPILLSVFFLYDEQKNKITSYLKVITENRTQVTEYVSKTYSSVTVQISENWMRLDFIDNDGKISKDELQNSMYGLYDFLKNYDLIEKTTQIKGKLYEDAITYMQKELEEDQKAKDLKEQQ